MAGIQSSAGGLTSASLFSNHSDPGVAESQQSTDTEAQSLTTEQSLSGGLTTEERLKASQSPLEQFVSESTESVSEFASNAWQGIKSLDQEYALTQRGLGILKVLGGAGEAAVGAVGIVTPEPATTIGGGILFVHGADVASSGLKEFWTGKPEETLTDQAVTEGAKMLGADDATAHQLGDSVDLSLSLGSGGVGIYQSMTRPVTAQLGPMTLKPKVVSESVEDLAKSELSTSPKTIMGFSEDAASSVRLEAQGLGKADGVSDVGATMRGGSVGPHKVESFTTKAAFDGNLYPDKKVNQLVQYLNKRGIDVMESQGNPAFIGKWDGTGTMKLPANPTELQVKHELSHYLDFRNSINQASSVREGVQNFVDMGRLGREQSVLDRLQSNRIWGQLNDAEKSFSIDYVDRLKLESGK